MNELGLGRNTNYQLGWVLGSGLVALWALGNGQVIQVGNVWREDLDNRMSTGRVKVDG